MLPSTLLANTASGSENETESCYAKATDVYNGVFSERIASLLTRTRSLAHLLHLLSQLSQLHLVVSTPVQISCREA